MTQPWKETSHPKAVPEPPEVPTAAALPEGTQYTAWFKARENGSREIYVYLFAGDCLDFEDSENGTAVDVMVKADGHREWAIKLAPGDVLQTGRLRPPPGA